MKTTEKLEKPSLLHSRFLCRPGELRDDPKNGCVSQEYFSVCWQKQLKSKLITFSETKRLLFSQICAWSSMKAISKQQNSNMKQNNKTRAILKKKVLETLTGKRDWEVIGNAQPGTCVDVFRWCCFDQSQQRSGHANKPKSQTNYRCCLRFSFLSPDWLSPCNTIAFQKYF